MNPDLQQTIEIDCDPCSPRPDTYYKEVIKDTGLEERETVSRVFGNWTWDYNDVPKEVFDKAKPILKERLTKLYNEGKVRYCSW